MDYGARFYLPGLGKFISADTIVPGAGNPQALNRFSYVLNNPLKFVDPSGHDPFQEQAWLDIEKNLGRPATWADRMAYLYTLAYPDDTHFTQQSFFGNKLDAATMQSWVRSAFVSKTTSTSPTRDWSGLPTALRRLADHYTVFEKYQYMRDITSLYTGDLDRFDQPNELSRSELATPPNGHVWIRANGMSKDYMDDDADSNVHHWMRMVYIGYAHGEVPAQAANAWHEGRNNGNQLDLRLGMIGANMGGEMQPFWVSRYYLADQLDAFLTIAAP